MWTFLLNLNVSSIVNSTLCCSKCHQYYFVAIWFQLSVCVCVWVIGCLIFNKLLRVANFIWNTLRVFPSFFFFFAKTWWYGIFLFEIQHIFFYDLSQRRMAFLYKENSTKPAPFSPLFFKLATVDCFSPSARIDKMLLLGIQVRCWREKHKELLTKHHITLNRCMCLWGWYFKPFKHAMFCIFTPNVFDKLDLSFWQCDLLHLVWVLVWWGVTGQCWHT